MARPSSFCRREESGVRRAVSLVQLVKDPDDRSAAEVAIVVRDDYQREGLGRALSRLTGLLAPARGVRTLRIHTLAENQAIMRLIRGFGVPFSAETRRGETTVIIPVAAQ
jgi:GNAT superfamily N-acetyltransferase